MKTTGFRTLVLGTPWRNLTYLIIETDEGITGIGEARILGKTHTVTEFLKDVERSERHFKDCMSGPVLLLLCTQMTIWSSFFNGLGFIKK